VSAPVIVFVKSVDVGMQLTPVADMVTVASGLSALASSTTLYLNVFVYAHSWSRTVYVMALIA
jgi:hypothetical protein